MKEYAARYVLYDIAEFWTRLTKFQGLMNKSVPRHFTYEKWKKAIISLYSSAEESTHHMVIEIQKLVQNIFATGIYMLGMLSTYYHDFQ